MQSEEASEGVFGGHVDGDVDRLSESRADERFGRCAVGVFVAVDADRVWRKNRLGGCVEERFETSWENQRKFPFFPELGVDLRDMIFWRNALQ